MKYAFEFESKPINLLCIKWSRITPRYMLTRLQITLILDFMYAITYETASVSVKSYYKDVIDNSIPMVKVFFFL